MCIQLHFDNFLVGVVSHLSCYYFDLWLRMYVFIWMDVDAAEVQEVCGPMSQ
jgi:hypothetical protein